MKKIVLCFLAIMVFAGSASAHEFLLKPTSATVGKGSKIEAEVQAAHTFMQSDEMESLKDVEVNLIYGKAPAALKLIEKPEEKILLLEGVAPASEPMLLAGHRKPQIWSETISGVEAGGRELEKKGFKVVSVGSYEKFAKTLLNADNQDKTIYNKILGQDLEIQLLDNPAVLKAGDILRCKVLFKGKPVAGDVFATYDGFSEKEDTYAEKVKTGKDGIALVKISKPGLWLIRAAQTSKLDSGPVDEHYLRATYVFEVK